MVSSLSGRSFPVHGSCSGVGIVFPGEKAARTGRKLDLAYFTEPGRCPLMVRRGGRSAFELFLYLAHRFLESNGEPVLANHEAMCHACGLDPDGPHSWSAVSRLLRSLRNTFGVIDYEPLQRRRPQIRLAPARPAPTSSIPAITSTSRGGWNEPSPSGFRRAWAAGLLGRIHVLDRGV